MKFAYLEYICVIVFLASPIILLLINRKIKLSGIKIIILEGIISWLIIVALLYFKNQHLNYELGILNGKITPEIQNEIDSDGAQNVFGLYFGWLYGIVYLIPWIIIIKIFNKIRKKNL